MSDMSPTEGSEPSMTQHSEMIATPTTTIDPNNFSSILEVFSYALAYVNEALQLLIQHLLVKQSICISGYHE